MERRESLGQRRVALLLLALLPILGAVSPVLDILPEDLRPGIETHHHPGTHGLPHSHLSCIQQDASQWIVGFPVLLSTPEYSIPVPIPLGNPLPHSSTLASLPDVRAPPIA
jgi:hypothetical protein